MAASVPRIDFNYLTVTGPLRILTHDTTQPEKAAGTEYDDQMRPVRGQIRAPDGVAEVLWGELSNESLAARSDLGEVAGETMSHFEDVAIQTLMREAIETAKDDESTVECYYRDVKDWNEQIGPVIRCTVAELPQRTFDDGFGSEEGEAIIAFSPKYVYVKGVYDGSEWIEAIPRHPDYINPDDLPSIGGG